MLTSWLPRRSRRSLTPSLLALALLAGGLAAASDTTAPAAGAAKPAKPARKPAPEEVQATTPPFSEGIFPCSGCHDGKEKVNTARRELGFHEEQQSVFAHDAEHRWCLDCHDAQKRDLLHLTNGDLVPYTESYRLCGQCHGDKLRDWRAGIHGKRIGRWNGTKTYFLCVNCHNPHAPLFRGEKEVVVDGKTVVMPTLEEIKPEPRPRRPEEVRP
jgi:hypothetical protein